MLMKGMKDDRRREERQKGTDNRPLGREAGYMSFTKVSAVGSLRKVDIAIESLLSARSWASAPRWILRQRFWIRWRRWASADDNPTNTGQAYSIKERIRQKYINPFQAKVPKWGPVYKHVNFHILYVSGRKFCDECMYLDQTDLFSFLINVNNSFFCQDKSFKLSDFLNIFNQENLSAKVSIFQFSFLVRS